MERLIKNEIIPDLDFSYFDTYVDCIKGNLTTKIRNDKADRCTELLGVIHTNICGSFTHPAMGGHKYFIMFIDDYSTVIVLSSSFVRSLTLWRLSKLKLSSNKGRRSKWFIMTEVVSIMVDIMRRDTTLDHLQSTFRNVASMLDIQCLVLLNRMRL